MTYANGRAPESALVKVDGLHTVPSIAPRVLAFIAYAKEQDRILRLAHPYGSYRNLAEQGKVTAGIGATIIVASVGSSTHGVYDVGRIDFVGADGYTYTAVELKWVVANAGKFGLVREFPTSDPNHFMASGSFAGDSASDTVSIGEENMAVKIWHYTAGGVDMKIVIDHLNMTYRQIVKGSIEDQGLQNDIDKGFARMDEIGQEAWAANFGAGQFLPITKPPTPSGSSTIDYAALAKAVNDDAAKRLSE